jgi:hypothetical protein
MMYWYLVAMIAVFLLSYWAYIARPRQCADLMGVSVLLSVVFVVNNVLVELYGFPDVMLAAPVLDLALCVMIYRAWKANPEPWKVFMVCALVAQLMLHAVAISMWRGASYLCRGGQWILHRPASYPRNCRGLTWAGSSSPVDA